jgi:hypothetical protein
VSVIGGILDEIHLLDFVVEDPSCENTWCRFGRGPVRFRVWFEPVCECGITLFCSPCVADLETVLNEPGPFVCRDCDASYPGSVKDHLRIVPLPPI